MRRYIPLVILLLVALGLLAMYGPGVYRTFLFRRACSAMLNHMEAGDTQAWATATDAAQQQRVQQQVERLPTDHAQYIASLKLTSYECTDPDTIWAIVTCRLTEEAGGGVYQGKLCWHWQDKRWVWDFTSSYAAPFVLGIEPDWVRLEEMLLRAEAH